MSILEDIHAGLFGTGGEYDDGSTAYSSATESTTTTATGKSYISASTRRGVDKDTATVYTRETEVTEYSARKTKNNRSHKGKTKEVNFASAATMVSRYDDGRTVGTSVTRGTKYTSKNSLASTNRYTTTSSGNKHTAIASHSTKGNDTRKRATLGKKKMETVMEERDDDESTMMYTTTTGISGRTSYYDEGDYDDDDDDNNTAYTVETGSTAETSSPWWTAFLHRADEENDTIISEIATTDTLYQPKAKGFMTVAATRDDEDDYWTQYSKFRNTTMLTYSHYYDDDTTAATMHNHSDEGKNAKEGSTKKWMKMKKQVVSNLNATWVATKAKITTVTPTDLIIPTNNKKDSLHSRKSAILVVRGKAQRKLSC
jgi:hypothetical protein